MDNADFTLLVVDDEDMNRDMLVHRLCRLGFHVGAAEGGEEARRQREGRRRRAEDRE